MEPEQIAESTDLQLVERYKLIGEMQDALAAERKALTDEIFARIPGNGKQIGSYSVTKVNRPNYQGVSLDVAKELGAVKTKEVVEGDMLKSIHSKGVEIPGLNYIYYPLIKNLEAKK